MSDASEAVPLDRLATGIPGLDEITLGGLPVDLHTLVAQVSGPLHLGPRLDRVTPQPATTSPIEPGSARR